MSKPQDNTPPQRENYFKPQQKTTPIQAYYEEYLAYVDELKQKGITSALSFKKFCAAVGYK